MSEKPQQSKSQAHSDQLPEDVAALYTWANLHGAKYHDFSRERREARSRPHPHPASSSSISQPVAQENNTPVIGELLESGSSRVMAEEVSQGASAEADAKSDFVTQEGVPSSEAQSHPSVPPIAMARGAWEEFLVASNAPPSAAGQNTAAQASASAIFGAGNSYYGGSTAHNPAPGTDGFGAIVSAPLPVDFAVEGEALPLFQPHEVVNSRWSALRDVLARPSDTLQVRAFDESALQAPVIAVFSLAGGVGKTGIVATLGRSLAGRGENTLLVDTNSYGTLPQYYGARDVLPGVVRTFTASVESGQAPAPVQILSLNMERLNSDSNSLPDEVVLHGSKSNRVLIDIATASTPVTRQVLRLSPRVLVPLAPDASSLANLQAVEDFFDRISTLEGRLTEPFYILNCFDPSAALHLEVSEILRHKLGDRLLPLALHRTPAMTEALAEGMTVIDYSPGAPIAEDFSSLSSWIRNLSAPAGDASRNRRWSEQQSR